MNILLQTQHYLGRRSRLACTPLLAAMLLSATAYAGPAQPVERISTVKESARVNVTGTVKDDKGQPLPGVSVKIKGTTTGTSTDVNGTFRINLPTGNETLVFSFIGFKTREVAVNGQTTINVSLAESTSELNEVVVVGYGTQKKIHVTSSVVSINANEVEELPSTNIGATLAGRLQGVGVSGGISRPGSKATITVRNPVGSYGKDAGSPQPLYVIDGVIQVDGKNSPDATLFNNLDPVEIESISVLKDASAAIYGSRGANGVILVTTKRGKSGKPRISYNGSYALNDEAYRTKMMNAYQFGQYFNIMNGVNGANSLPTSNTYKNNIFTNDELEYFKGINNDWLSDAWSSSYLTRHTLSLSGGADKATYFGSVGYSKQDGNIGTTDYNRWNFRAGTDVQVASNLKVGLQVSGNEDNLSKTFNKVSGEGVEDDYKNLLLTPTYVPMYINGMPAKIPGTNNDLSMFHFYELQRLGNLAVTDTKFYTFNVTAEYKIPFVDGLKARAMFARNSSSSVASQVGTKYTIYQFKGTGEHEHIYDENATVAREISASNGNRIYYSNFNQKNTQFNFLLNYDKTFGKHSVSGLVTVERGEAENEQEDVWKADPLQQTNGQFNTAFGALDARTSFNESGSLGYIGRVNYAYANKYLAEFLFRSDASTKFAPENYWGRFYSGSLGWVVSEEDFFKIPAVNYLKVRYSTGLLGNDQFTAWLWRQRYTFQEGKGGVFGGNTNTSTGMKMEQSPNRNAQWSKEFKNNLGIDARFLRDRLSATVDGYYNKASDVLIARTALIPVTVGGSVASENYGKVDQFGWELELGWNEKVGRNFNYGISARLNWADNKVKQMNFNPTDIMYPWNAQPNQSDDNGKWGYDYLGMFKTQEDIDNYVSQYNITSVNLNNTTVLAREFRPGMLYYRDVRGALQSDGTFAGPDGIIDANDQIQLAKKASNHYGYGLTLKAGYKNLSFDCVLAGSFGGWSEISERKKLNNDISRVFASLPEIWGNIYDPVLNPSGTMPNPNWSSIYDVPSEFWRVSSFRMRMTSFNLNYSLPKKVAEKLRVSNARFYLSGLNPFNLYNPYSYKDPSAAWDAYPNLKTYSFGMNLTL
ncbi:SusC/RagA family TonB-linked outer membrane protein [Desertivirga arenae]|uniref:SusC/RagA family TonB-linked outer membrane protein n=1 Tax=Desertivirga arenae TaxID=2810309 RepID=UPI001A979CC8|nr:TonB-dependent receptor [Pedobacter sp. SYSU D00823]